MGKLSAKIEEEFRALLPPTVFFFVTLSLVGIIRSLLLKGTGIKPSGMLSIVVGALLLGKAVLVADWLPAINRYPDKPLAYNVTWKTMIYVLIALLLHYLERLVDFWREAGGLVSANHKLFAEMIWPHFWGIQLLLLVLVIVYCTASELFRVIGGDKVRQIFFGSRRK